MKRSNLLTLSESYAKECMTGRKGGMMIAHDFNHVNRVRNWAMTITTGERFPNLEMVEVTALLHDVGLSHLNDGSERKDHGPVGAEIASAFLRSSSDLNEGDIVLIADAIHYHGLSPSVVAEHLKVLGEKGKLLEIIRDADNLDGMGAAGIMRAFASRYYLPEYDPLNIKGSTWGLSSTEFHERFGYDANKGLAPVKNMIDQVNQQVRLYENLHTKTAMNLGKPLVQYMKSFVLELEHEIDHRERVMKAFLSIKFWGDDRNREQVETVIKAFEGAGYKVFCVRRDAEDWGKIQFASEEMMRLTFNNIDDSDFLIADVSDWPIGVGVEAGYAHAKGIPVIGIYPEGKSVANSVAGFAKRLIKYNDGADLKSKLTLLDLHGIHNW